MLEFENIPENEIEISESLKMETEKEFPILKRQYENEQESDKAYFNNLKYGSEPAVQEEIKQTQQTEEVQKAEQKNVPAEEKENRKENESSITKELAEIAELKMAKRNIEMEKEKKNEYLGESNLDRKAEQIEDLINNREEIIEGFDDIEIGEKADSPLLKEETREVNLDVVDDFQKTDIDYEKNEEYYLHVLKANQMANDLDPQKEKEVKVQMMKELNDQYKYTNHEKVVQGAVHFTSMEKNDPVLRKDYSRQREQERNY